LSEDVKLDDLINLTKNLAISTYHHYSLGAGYDLEDIIAQANLCLCGVINNPPKDKNINGYLKFKVRRFIIDYVRKNGFLGHRAYAYRKSIMNFVNDYFLKNDKKPTIEIIHENFPKFKLSYIEFLLSPHLEDFYSYDEIVENGAELIDNRSLNPESISINKQLLNLIRELSKTELSKTEYKVLKYILEGKTQAEIAEIFGVTPGNISQIYKRIINKYQKRFTS